MPHRTAKTLVLLGFILTAALPAQADQKTATGETPVAARDYPWSAVGKLNNGVFAGCTAVLIAEHYALTAAHCLFFQRTGRFLPAESLHFILGYENQQPGNHLRVLAYFIPPTYNPLKPFATIASDWALLQVSGDSRPAVRPLSVKRDGKSISGSNLMTAGYSGRTPFRMTADKECQLVGRSSDNKLLFDSCYAPEGYSGGPLLVEDPDKRSYSVAGIHIGNQVWQGRAIALAVSAETIWREIRPCIERGECFFQHFAGARDPSAAEILAGFSKFGLGTIVDLLSDPPCANGEADCTPAYAESELTAALPRTKPPPEPRARR